MPCAVAKAGTPPKEPGLEGSDARNEFFRHDTPCIVPLNREINTSDQDNASLYRQVL